MVPSVVNKSSRFVADVLKLCLRSNYFLAEVGVLEVAPEMKTFFLSTFFD